MRRPEASYAPRSKYNSEFEGKVSKDVPAEEREVELIEEPVVEHVPQSSLKSDSDDSEEIEEDPEEECEDDPEEELEDDTEEECEDDPEEELEDDPEEECEDDPEEEPSGEPVKESAEEPSDSVSIDEDGSKEISSKLFSQSRIDGNDHQSGSNDDHSKENKRSLDTTSDSDLLQVNQKKFRHEETFKPKADSYGESVVSEAKQQEHTGTSGKRRRSRWDEPQPEQDGEPFEGNEKRRKTRWASDVPNLKMLGPIQPPDFIKDFIGSDLDPAIQKLKLRLSELNSKLLSSELHYDRPEEKRSPSPVPEYNNLGIRINTREVRLREKLNKERRRVLSKLIKKNPTFKAPPDYKPPKLFKKLYIPVKEYPTYNFVGLIIGPRGNTQKKLEKETGARILLRGKGSVKRPEEADSSDKEDLHVYIEADNQKSLDAAVKMVEKLLIPVDEEMNDHKRVQLEELAKLNGTYRKGNICTVCKQEGHKDYACPHQQSTFKMEITCAMCGSFCHPSSSCPTKGKPKKETSDSDLYVGYLPQAVDENWLRELFCPFGKITEVKVIVDRNTGLSKGYGFVKFENTIDAAMAVTHMNGHKMEGKMLAVRVAGRPPPGVGLSAMSHLPIYPGPPAAISANVLSHRGVPTPPGYMLPDAQSSFGMNEGFGFPSSSLSSGHCNHHSESKAVDTSPSVVSTHMGSQLASSFDSFYTYPNKIPFSSPGLTSQCPVSGDGGYPGSQLLSYSSTPTLKPSPPLYHLSQDTWE